MDTQIYLAALSSLRQMYSSRQRKNEVISKVPQWRVSGGPTL